jgi:hypothetical protein
MRAERLLIPAAIAVLFTAVMPVRARQQPAAAAQAPSLPAIITPAKPVVPEGFTSIFNGEDLSGWHVSTTNHHGTTPDYHVLHGVIVATQKPFGRGGILLTDKKYKNVEVYLEVKPDYGCDSGLFLRSNEAGDAYQVTMDYLPGGSIGGIYGEGLQGVGGRGTPAARGTQAAAAGANRGGAGGAAAAAPNQQAGGRGANASATPSVAGGIPLGGSTAQGEAPWMKVWKREDWNKVRVRIAGDVPHITVWLNDQQITDFTDTANHAKDGITEGPIAIQVHGGTRWVPGGFWRWRTIGVKELPADAK